MLTISASDLRTWQTCRRRWLLEQHWKVARWKPASLFRSCLREGVFALSNGSDAPMCVATARTRFLSQAANPGLDVMSGDVWQVAQDWAGMIGVVLTAISRLTLLTLTRPPALSLSDAVAWLPLSFADDTGTLHRWITVDAWDQDALAREAHSWHVIGDMVLCDAPMMIHVVAIGQQRGRRRHSPWARCYRHPIIAGMYRFQRPDGKGGWRKLSGDKWKPLWYADQNKPDPAAWCDLMDSDHVTQSLLHHISISQPSQAQAGRIRQEMLQVAEEMRRRLSLAEHPGSPMEEPMARAACDPVWGPCAWQQVCFREEPQHEIGELGLYWPRAARGDERSSPSPRLESSHLSYDTVATSR